MSNPNAHPPLGNTNGRKNLKPRVWQDAIRRALARREKGQPKRLNRLADKLLDLCEQGDVQAIKEFGDRIEGRPTPIIEAGDGDVIMLIKRVVAEPDYIEGETVNEALPDNSK